MAFVDTVHWRIIEAVANKIASIGLPLITWADGPNAGQSRVYHQMWPEESVGYWFATGATTTITFPCVLLSAENEVEETGENSDTGNMDWRYPVRIWVLDKSKDQAKAPEYYAARKTIIDRLHDQSDFAGVPEAVRCRIVPGPIFDRRLPEYQTVITAILVRFETSEERAA